MGEKKGRGMQGGRGTAEGLLCVSHCCLLEAALVAEIGKRRNRSSSRPRFAHIYPIRPCAGQPELLSTAVFRKLFVPCATRDHALPRSTHAVIGTCLSVERTHCFALGAVFESYPTTAVGPRSVYCCPPSPARWLRIRTTHIRLS